MAGLLIKELLLRGDVERCLIVVPASLEYQWQDELEQKFQLRFDVVGRAEIENAATNAFTEHNLMIGRIDLLKQDEQMERLAHVEWDLVVVDEAHKMSATYDTSGDRRLTARYKLGQLLAGQTRHLLLMTATPHRGKEADFQLFMALLDEDRFDGRYRDAVHQVDASDLMRRLLKEEMTDFDGRPLFPERRAYTVNYELSDPEEQLYLAVTEYVTHEMTRADWLAQQEGGEGNQKRAIVGFALTMLQRRLASSPNAIYRSLERRRKRLEATLGEARMAQNQAEQLAALTGNASLDDLSAPRLARLDADELEDELDERPDTGLGAAQGLGDGGQRHALRPQQHRFRAPPLPHTPARPLRSLQLRPFLLRQCHTHRLPPPPLRGSLALQCFIVHPLSLSSSRLLGEEGRIGAVE
jgi:hypothetical protein